MRFQRTCSASNVRPPWSHDHQRARQQPRLFRVQSGFRWLLGAVEGAEPHQLTDPDGVAQRAPLVVLGAGLAFAGKVTARTLEVFVADMSA
jgi:hypothetical protein